MPTPFKFENVFRAPSVEAVLAAYFDPDHLATQDKVAELVDRVVVEDVDGPETRKTSWKVGSSRPLPVFVRPFIGSRLSYVETMTWRKQDNAIDLTVVPQILNGRVGVEAVYQLSSAGEGHVLRRYAGTVTANITLLSGKIEKGVLAAFEKEMPVMTKCTQDWLDRTVNARS